jgi:hypothetical protein
MLICDNPFSSGSSHFKTSAQIPEIEPLIQTKIHLICYSVLYREAMGGEEVGFELITRPHVAL